MSRRRNMHRYFMAGVLVVTLAAVYFQLAPVRSLAAEDSLLRGRVSSSSGQPLAGVPVRARRENSNIAVSVYTDGHGDYLFPGWSDVSAGSYSIGIDLPDFEPIRREAVTLSAGKTARVEFTLQSRQPPSPDATASRVCAARPRPQYQN